MTITAAPTVPNPNSATFAADAYPFTQWMAAIGPEIDAETARINTLGYGTYSATSATSLTVGTGSKSLTIEAGKSFAVGQPVVIASTAGPTNYMTGQVTSYNSGTGALVVNATAIGGSGTVAAWTISIASIVAGGGVSPDSIVVLTSGTSWTCPAGVTKAVVSVQGGGGGGSGSTATANPAFNGGGGGTAVAAIAVTPGLSYIYAIGAGGSGGTSGGGAGGVGSATTFTANGVTYTGDGGGGGVYATRPGVGGSATNGQSNISGNRNGATATGYGTGGGIPNAAVAGAGTAGGNGAIILELYK